MVGRHFIHSGFPCSVWGICVLLCVSNLVCLGPNGGCWSEHVQSWRNPTAEWRLPRQGEPPAQTCPSLSLGMVNPQIRLIQAATVPLSSSPLSLPQSHSRPPSGHSWLMGFPSSLSCSCLALHLRKKYFYAFLQSFKVGFCCFLITEIPWIILLSQIYPEQMARKISLPPNLFLFTSLEYGFPSRLNLPSLLHYFILPHPS